MVSLGVGAESQNHRESNHGKTGNGDPFWGLKSVWAKWPNHGGFGGHFTGITDNFQITAVSRLGGPETAPATGQAHPHHVAARFREPKRLRSFGNYLSIESQKTKWATWVVSLWLWSLEGVSVLWVRVLWESGSANLGPRRGKDGFYGSSGLAR